MANNGWIKIHRKLVDKGYYRKSEYVHLWIHLLIKANHEGKEFLWNNKIMQVHRGQILTGRSKLTFETGIERNKIERILKCFESEQQIEQQTFSKFRLITVKKYEDYQKNEQENEPQVSNKRAASEQQVSTNKNEKNYKNEKNISMGRFAPPTLDEVSGYCSERKNGISAQKFFDFYTSKGWFIGKNKMKDWKAAVRTWEKGSDRAGSGATVDNDQRDEKRKQYEQDFYKEYGFYPSK